MKSRTVRSLSCLMVLTTLVACSVLTPRSSGSLDGTSWVLESYATTEPIPGTELTAEFEEGSIRGSSGCNSYGGSHQTDGRRIEIHELNSTLMACLDPEGAMEQEAAFLRILGDAQSYEIIGGRLQILSSDGERLTFLPQD